MTCNLYHGFARILTKTFTSEFPHVERYFWTMVNQPNFKKVIGDFKQAEVVPPVQKKAAPAKPKEAKKEAPKAAPKPAEVEAPEEEAPKPKPKNPLDLLPPSKMVLDDWKRLYSNTKSNFHDVAVKGIILSNEFLYSNIYVSDPYPLQVLYVFINCLEVRSLCVNCDCTT
uniref:Uncharacterized protein n=1 Tax=Aegilops tauschii subsp. strangulata TaxID=200361 RepID=A0A453SCL2_AEGTS